MPVPKATHKGHCQVCSELRRLPNNRVPTHGYVVMGVKSEEPCPGSGALPMELARELADMTVEGLRHRAKQIEDIFFEGPRNNFDTSKAPVFWDFAEDGEPKNVLPSRFVTIDGIGYIEGVDDDGGVVRVVGAEHEIRSQAHLKAYTVQRMVTRMKWLLGQAVVLAEDADKYHGKQMDTV